MMRAASRASGGDLHEEFVRHDLGVGGCPQEARLQLASLLAIQVTTNSSHGGGGTNEESQEKNGGSKLHDHIGAMKSVGHNCAS
mmetsp:Transcript_22312/g.48489  ORF Transcript_22312/g.48489 Transcript_22312/m.48489 type:complete len:84 (+) Transcript_22312:98-349(+)